MTHPILEAWSRPGVVKRFRESEPVLEFCRRHGIPSLTEGGCMVFAHALERAIHDGELYGGGDGHTWGLGHVTLLVNNLHHDGAGAFTAEELTMIMVSSPPYLGHRFELLPLDQWTEGEREDIWMDEWAVENMKMIILEFVSSLSLAVTT